MRAGEVPVPRYVITKGLNKAPHEYPDAKSQPHVQVSVVGAFVRSLLVTGCTYEYQYATALGLRFRRSVGRSSDDTVIMLGAIGTDA